MRITKYLAEGFGKAEDLVCTHEINLRMFMNCFITLGVIQAGVALW